MRKLTLDLERLDVQSFETVGEARAARGTVRGHDQQTAHGPRCGDTSIADACVTGLCTFDCPETTVC